jgi:hypothetical protein
MHESRRMSPQPLPRVSTRLTAGEDTRQLDVRPVGSDAGQEIVELADAAELQPAGISEEVGGSPFAWSDLTVEGPSDPLYQALVATGFLRPR